MGLRRLTALITMVGVFAGFSSASATTPPTVTIVAAYPGFTNPPADQAYCLGGNDVQPVAPTCKINSVEFVVVDGGGAPVVDLFIDLVNTATNITVKRFVSSTSSYGAMLRRDYYPGTGTSFVPGAYHWVVAATNSSGSGSASSDPQPWL